MSVTREQFVALEIADEVMRARSLFAAIHNPHEGLGVVREEYIEFEAEVFKLNIGKGRDTRPEIRKELIQLAAMAVRTILDCNLQSDEEKEYYANQIRAGAGPCAAGEPQQ